MGQQHGKFVLQVLWFCIPHFVHVLLSLLVVMDLNEFRLNCTFGPLTFPNLRIWPPNFHNITFGPLTLARFAKSAPPIDFDQVNAHVDNDSHATLACHVSHRPRVC
jgi:hypothetical protein